MNWELGHKKGRVSQNNRNRPGLGDKMYGHIWSLIYETHKHEAFLDETPQISAGGTFFNTPVLRQEGPNRHHRPLWNHGWLLWYPFVGNMWEANDMS